MDKYGSFINNECKIVFVGDSGVGKTSIIQRFVTSEFNEDVSATIGAMYISKTFILDDKEYKLQVCSSNH